MALGPGLTASSLHTWDPVSPPGFSHFNPFLARTCSVTCVSVPPSSVRPSSQAKKKRRRRRRSKPLALFFPFLRPLLLTATGAGCQISPPPPPSFAGVGLVGRQSRRRSTQHLNIGQRKETEKKKLLPPPRRRLRPRCEGVLHYAAPTHGNTHHNLLTHLFAPLHVCDTSSLIPLPPTCAQVSLFSLCVRVSLSVARPRRRRITAPVKRGTQNKCV